jgi:hypothetical protein
METLGTTGTDSTSMSGDGDANNLPEAARAAAQMGSRLTHKTADQLHRAASALRERASSSVTDTGAETRVTRFADNAAGAMDSAAEYVNGLSVTGVRDDLGTVIRRYPLQSLAVGFGVGFLAARIVRR